MVVVVVVVCLRLLYDCGVFGGVKAWDAVYGSGGEEESLVLESGCLSGVFLMSGYSYTRAQASK